jgi:hypothetical protein
LLEQTDLELNLTARHQARRVKIAPELLAEELNR